MPRWVFDDDVLAALGMTRRDLFPERPKQHRSVNQPAFELRKIEHLDWRECVEAFSQRHLERLAKWRGYSIEFCHWLKDNGLVGLYDGCIAFPVHDRAGNVVAAHYRLKDGSWRYYPQGAKVRPLVIGELLPGEPVQCFESTWDGFDYTESPANETASSSRAALATAHSLQSLFRKAAALILDAERYGGREVGAGRFARTSKAQ